MAVAGAQSPDPADHRSLAIRARAGLMATPGVRLIRTYDRSWLPTDALAALTVWALLVRKQRAFGRKVGVLAKGVAGLMEPGAFSLSLQRRDPRLRRRRLELPGRLLS